MKRALYIAIIATLGATHVFADGTDIATKSALIQKFENVLELTEEGSSEDAKVKARLADLYSERARQKDFEAQGQSKDSKADRKRAIELYESVFNSNAEIDKGNVLLQMAQLYELTNQHPRAVKLYKKVVNAKRGTFEPAVVGQSYFGLGESEFSEMRYKKALGYFESALKIPETPKKEQSQYRKAWCLFYMENTSTAIHEMTAVLSQNPNLDNSFREQASRDLATFMAKTNVTEADAQRLHDLSPEASRIDNLSYLADELERLGKKRPALVVIALLGDKRKSDQDDNESSDRIADQLQKAKIKYDLGKAQEAVNEYAGAFEIWKNSGCEPSSHCETLRLKARKFVTDWGKAAQRDSHRELVRAYDIYASFFADIEVAYWGAEAARKLGQNTKSIELYRKVTEGFHSTSKKNISDRHHRMVEGALLGEVEVAEISKDAKLRESAYRNYLRVKPKGDKNVEVRYQLARLTYEAGNYPAAAEQMKDVALLNDDRSLDTREKAADLALDSLVLAKRDDLIESWAAIFSRKFKRKAVEFARISRKAVLNKAAVTLTAAEKGEDVSNRELRHQLDKLNGMTLLGMSDNEKVAYYRNKIILAEKLKDLDEVNGAANGLLSVKGLKADDREFAISRKAWVAEMKFDFKTAYKLTKQLSLSKQSTSERALKLGTLAHMADMNPTRHFEEYLQSTKDRKGAAGIAAVLIRRAKLSKTAFRKYSGYLRGDLALFASVSLEVFAKSRDPLFAEAVLRSTPRIRKMPAGIVLDRFMYIRQFQRSFGKNVVYLNQKSNKTLERSLKESIHNLRKMENFAQDAIMSGDWTRQILVVTHVARQYQRLGMQIMALRAPRGLNSKQKAQYRQLLQGQAAPYFKKQEELESRLGELWAQSDIIESIGTDYKVAKGVVRSLLADEIRLVKSLAPANYKRVVARLFDQRPDSVSNSELRAARNNVKSDPFSVRKLEKLKELENKAGQEVVVAYLDARVSQISGGRR